MPRTEAQNSSRKNSGTTETLNSHESCLPLARPYRLAARPTSPLSKGRLTKYCAFNYRRNVRFDFKQCNILVDRWHNPSLGLPFRSTLHKGAFRFLCELNLRIKSSFTRGTIPQSRCASQLPLHKGAFPLFRERCFRSNLNPKTVEFDLFLTQRTAH